jgi:hypothetical protein
MLAILLILLTNHALFHYGTLIYSQQENRISNQVKSKTIYFILNIFLLGLRQLVVMLEIKIVKKALSILQKNNSDESGK